MLKQHRITKQKKASTPKKVAKKSPKKVQKRAMSAAITPELKSRLGYQPYESKVMSARDAIERFLKVPKKNADGSLTLTNDLGRDLILGTSGFTSVGYPKQIPVELCKMAAENGYDQGQLQYILHVGASTGPEFDSNMAAHNLISRRYPYQLGKDIQNAINKDKIQFSDQHLSSYVDRLAQGFYSPKSARGTDKHVDVAIIEATEITADGHIIPGLSVGASPEIAHSADKIIIELNTKLPSCRGLHDITEYRPPGQRQPYMITSTKDRIGEEFIRIDPSRVVAVIESRSPDNTTDAQDGDDTSQQIADHIVEFFKHEVAMGRMPKNLYNLQSGIGNIANKVIGGIKDGDFENVNVWTEVLQDTFLDFFESGKLDMATSTSIKLSPKGFERLFANFDFYKSKIILRNQAVSNAPELVQRLGIVAMNTPVEFDLYGHANSTHVGSRMISGLGGSNDFLRNAAYSIMHTPSTRKSKTDPHGISCIVPRVCHVDQTEHDVNIYVTENGLADLRGMSPKERAREIIDKTAHPKYKDQLNDYINHAYTWNKTNGGGLHSPHLLNKSFNMHMNLQMEGSMYAEGIWDKQFLKTVFFLF
eukprot:UN01807